MENNERKLSDFIDRLNNEQQPDEDEHSTESDELKELYQTAKLVRSLKEPAMPGPDFQKKLIHSVEKELSKQTPRRKRRWPFFLSIASAAAILVLIINIMLPIGNNDIVTVMADAFEEVDAYHGTLEIVETNAEGESTKQATLEVWADDNGHYYTKILSGPNKGVITVNNGEKKWQIQPDQKQVHLLPTLPDGHRFSFELGNEINEARNALTTELVGEDTIAGRETTILQVTPKGGEPYHIWIDNETKLPLQKETAMQHAIQYKMTYTEMEFSSNIPEKLMTYQVPKGYEVIDKNPEQTVTDMREVEEAIGFTPKTPENLPSGYVLERITLVPGKKLAKVYYRIEDTDKQIVLTQGPSNGKLNASSSAMLGKIGNHTAEIQAPVQDYAGILGGVGPYAGDTGVNSIRWMQDGFEFAVVGTASLDELASFTEHVTNSTLKIPDRNKQEFSPEIDVPYDIEQEKNDQKNADAGSSPWKLDPAFVTQVFVSLKISPEGITGDYPISIDDLDVIKNTVTEAIVEVNSDKTTIQKVYLKRLIRQDSTGIWTVVGYDQK